MNKIKGKRARWYSTKMRVLLLSIEKEKEGKRDRETVLNTVRYSQMSAKALLRVIP